MNQYFNHDTSTIDQGAKIGAGTKIWHYTHVMNTAEIGKACILGQNVFVGSKVKIGNRVKIQNNVSLYEGAICEDDVFIGPSVVFTNIINPRSFIERKDQYIETVIKKGASIGANATIVCGNIIGAYSMIGAGSVVTKEVPPYALVVGVPGIVVGWVSEAGEKLNFGGDGIATCSDSDDVYLLMNGQVQKR